MDEEKIKDLEIIEKLFFDGKKDKEIATLVNKKITFVSKARSVLNLRRSYRVNIFEDFRQMPSSPYGLICPRFIIPANKSKELGLDQKRKYTIKAKVYSKNQILLTVSN